MVIILSYVVVHYLGSLPQIPESSMEIFPFGTGKGAGLIGNIMQLLTEKLTEDWVNIILITNSLYRKIIVDGL